MLKLNEKYIFHIPSYKYVNDELVAIADKNILDKLIRELDEKGYHSLYILEAKGYYKSRCFDEILINLYVSDGDENPSKIFSKWFKDNNDELKQESYAYEHNGKLYIGKL